ncbi:MAG: hypothetical protein QF805_28275, partial [Pirellulaceae bacterium]|nr:hypothetical protein [Pirellulaceae bacterium]
DRVASWLVAFLIVVGFGVTQMFLIWLTAFPIEPDWKIDILPPPRIGTPDDRVAQRRAGEEVEEPGEEIEEPHQLARTLQAVTDIVSTQAAAFDQMGAVDELPSGRRIGGDGGPDSSTSADPAIPPASERWRLQYQTESLENYARQLDHFQIELAAVTPGGKIHYATELAGGGKTRVTDGAGETRLFFAWRSGKLEQFDRRLLELAGVATKGGQVVQFIPGELEQQLLRLELTAAGDTTLENIRLTYFGVRPRGDGFEFYVITQVRWRDK